MSTKFNHWLPFEAIFDGVLETCITDIVTSWQTHWLGESLKFDQILLIPNDTEKQIANTEMGWLFSNGENTVEISLNEGGLRKLSGTMLNVKVPAKPSQEDLKFLEALVEKSLIDMCQKLSHGLNMGDGYKILNSEDDFSHNSNYTYKIGINLASNFPLMSILVHDDCLIKARKSACSSRESSMSIHEFETALSNQKLNIGFHGGESRISLPEIHNLSIGDVIVLDKKIREPMNSILNGRPVEGLPCNVHQSNNTMAMKFSLANGD